MHMNDFSNVWCLAMLTYLKPFYHLRASIQELYHAALEKQKLRRITRMVSGTYGHWSLG